MKIRNFAFHKMDESIARQISFWKYNPPYDIYNCNSDEREEHIQELLFPEYHYYSLLNDAEDVIGFQCFGKDAQVPGGDYRMDALDMGGGLRPDLTGKGLGSKVIEEAMMLAHDNFHPKVFRTTIALFNKRAIKACEKVGYQLVDTFQSTHSNNTFVILTRQA